jgi:hypothetical protein
MEFRRKERGEGNLKKLRKTEKKARPLLAPGDKIHRGKENEEEADTEDCQPATAGRIAFSPRRHGWASP